MNKRIHILGPSGSGTTTLGVNLGARLQIKHLDTDDFYWRKTLVPFTEKEPPHVRLKKMERAMAERTNGCFRDRFAAGEIFFTHVIFLSLPWELREQRLLRREPSRSGADALAPGGEMHEIHGAFMKWASRYDTAGMEQRSRIVHERWMGELPKEIAIIRLDGLLDQETLTNLALREIGASSAEESARAQ